MRVLLTVVLAFAVSGDFTSGRYAYRLHLPGAWGAPSVEPGVWQPGTYPHTNDPGTDTWTDGRGRYFVVAAKPATARTTTVSLATEVARLARTNPDNACHVRGSHPARVGGVATVARRWRCANGYDLFDLAVVHGGRGYLVYLLNETGTAPSDIATFLRLLRGFSFRH
jgi:hypothetical protein